MLRARRPILTLASTAALVLLAAACNDSGSSSPTEPGGFEPQTASIEGDVLSGGAPMAGVEVTVDGAASAASTDGAGRFQLTGVPSGDRVLSFETGAARASLVVPKVVSGERIELSVSLAGSRAQVRAIRRTAPGAGALALSFSPDVWNLNGAGSSGQVQAFVRGTGYDSIDAGTVLLFGDDPTLPPLAPRRSAVEGDHLKATFGRADALALLPDPQPGEIRLLRLEFVQNGVPVALTGSITIAPDAEPGTGPLRVSIQPDSWNLNWAQSSGTVSAKIEGAGFDQIDPSSIVLVGTDPLVPALVPLRSERKGNHVRATFAKPAALATLDTPTVGESHLMAVEFLLGGAPGSLTDTVQIVGN